MFYKGKHRSSTTPLRPSLSLNRMAPFAQGYLLVSVVIVILGVVFR